MDIIAQIEAEQIASLNKEIPDFKAGDTIKVGYKVTEGTRSRVQNYEGAQELAGVGAHRASIELVCRAERKQRVLSRHSRSAHGKAIRRAT